MINIEELKAKTRALNDLLENPNEGDKDWQYAVAELAGSIDDDVASIRWSHNESSFSGSFPGIPASIPTVRDVSMWSPASA